MVVTTTGQDEATRVPEGAVLERVYFTAPDLYVNGPEYPSEAAAAAAGLARQEAAVAASRAQPGNGGVSFVAERFSVDVRWVLRFPDGGGIDLVARRTTYESFDDARGHLDGLTRTAR